MLRLVVDSQSLRSVGYDARSSTLEVEFKNGTVYQYRDVPSQAYQELLRADSLGAHINQYIKGQYEFSRVA